MLVGEPSSPFGIGKSKLPAVRQRVSFLALAPTNVLWQTSQWRAFPSPLGAVELSQHRRYVSTAGGDPSLRPRELTTKPLRTPSPRLATPPKLLAPQSQTNCAGLCNNLRQSKSRIAVRTSNLLKLATFSLAVPQDYQAFYRILWEAWQEIPIRILD
jgi:hypothetical protein